MKARVVLRIVLTVESDGDITPGFTDAVDAAHQRARYIAARVLLCGDAGGPMKVDVEPGTRSFPVVASAVTVEDGTTQIMRLAAHTKTGRKKVRP